MNRFRMFRSFQSRLIVTTLFFLILAIALPSILNTWYFIGNVQKQNEENTAVSFENIENELNRILYDAQIATYNIGNIDAVQKYLMNHFSSEVEAIKAKQAFVSAIDEAIIRYSLLDSVIFIKSDGSVAGSSARRRYFFDEHEHPFITTQDYRTVIESSDYVWLGYYPRSYFTENPSSADDEAHLIWGGRNIRYTFSDGSKPVSVIALFAVSEETLKDFSRYAGDTRGDICLLDNDGRKLIGDEAVAVGEVPAYFKEFTTEDFASIHYQNAQQEKYQVIFKRLNRTGWYLVKHTPMRLFSESIRPFWMFSILIGVVILLLISLLYAFWAKKMIRPLLQMCDALKMVSKNDMKVRMIPVSKESDEIILMKEQFNQMLDSINMLLKQKEADEQEKLRLEMHSLQAQITPHFLYNTIASIRWMAAISGANQVADMLVTLINLLRPVFSNWTADWTLAEELNYVENYMKLMRLRFGNLVTFQVENRLENNNIRLPRFILQPLLENCFSHSMKGDDPLILMMEFLEENDTIIIHIRDNGNGIPAERLEELNKMLRKTPGDQNGSGIGLINVNRRIQLFCGPEYGVFLDSKPGEGTCVTVKIGQGANWKEKTYESTTNDPH